MIRQLIEIKETIATVLAEERYIAVAEAEIRKQRQLLEDYISTNQAFGMTLEPYAVPADAPEIVRRMSEAGCKAGVGPMAAVAGALAEFALRAMVNAGATHAAVDNGGDVAMILDRPLNVGIFTGPSAIRNISFRCLPQSGIFGICTSSGTVGHSLSFGRADAAVVVAKDVCLADAVATALGNSIRQANPHHVRACIRRHRIPGVDGLLIVVGDLLAAYGQLPEIVPMKVDICKISGAKSW
jgi:ApbE superfamily uncharacterized protein (UPF0280 family)